MHGIGVESILPIGGQKQHDHPGIHLPDPGGQGDAVHPGHMDIQQRQVRRMVPEPVQRLLGVGEALRLVDLRNVLALVQCVFYGERLIVNTDRFHLLVCSPPFWDIEW